MISKFKGWFLIKFWPSRLVKRFQSNTNKRVFFLRQYEGTLKKVWGIEYSLKQMRNSRENLRREYDKLNEILDATKIALENNEKAEKPDNNVKENCEKIIETKLKEIEEWKKRIDLADETIGNMEDQVSGYREQLPELEKEIYG